MAISSGYVVALTIACALSATDGCTAPVVNLPGSSRDPTVGTHSRTVDPDHLGFVYGFCLDSGDVRIASNCSSDVPVDWIAGTDPPIDTTHEWGCWAWNHTNGPIVLTVTIQCEPPTTH